MTGFQSELSGEDPEELPQTQLLAKPLPGEFAGLDMFCWEKCFCCPLLAQAPEVEKGWLMALLHWCHDIMGQG